MSSQTKLIIGLAAFALPYSFAFAQSDTMSNMNAAGMSLMDEASGTSMNPLTSSMPMLMRNTGDWSWMFMSEGFLTHTQEFSPRGHDKLFSTNWLMIGTQRSLGQGSFRVRLMLSLEPATVTSRRYPELFQTGETAYGLPLVDAQHPHNFIMGLDFTYARALGQNGTWEILYAPIGDPALGPVAFPHRASASELPQAPLAHHWEDSTHISYNVATLAVGFKLFRWEVSGFHGAEPGENRWIVTSGAMDSWATRASVFPNQHWMAQFSAGRITHPEALQPGDVIRTTASLHYTRAVHGGDWSSSLIWGRNHDTYTKRNGNAYTLESVATLSRKNILTGRAELVEKDELFPTVAALDGHVFRIGAFTLGFTRQFGTLKALQTGLGANFTIYSLPAVIKPYYGGHPRGVDVYVRLRLKQPH